ncbi:MAG: hypothetical protein ACE5GZ_02225 [Gammaproteobacteria bacterium]
MADKELSCWKCGASLKDIPLPLSRLAKCKACNADLHVCMICEFYDVTVSKSCREPIAEEVKDKKRANFCGYLQPSANAYASQDPSSLKEARSELDTLFDLDSGASSNRDQSQADASKNELERLFGLNGKKHD